MAFDVSKFLALTALIASTGAACSSNDKDQPAPNEGGSAGSAGSNTSGSVGHPGGQGGAAEGGNGGAAAGNAGEGGVPAEGGVGGESLGGASGGAGGASGGAGGATDSGECLGSLAMGGAGGDAGVEPSLEGLCMDFFDTVCAGSEDFAPSYTVCEGVKERGQPAVAVAVADCIKALSAEEACDGVKVAACLTNLEGQGCANPDAATACASIKTNCDEVNLATCEKLANLVSSDAYEGFTGCMDPTDEGWYEPAFTGTCVERLDFCAGARLF